MPMPLVFGAAHQRLARLRLEDVIGNDLPLTVLFRPEQFQATTALFRELENQDGFVELSVGVRIPCQAQSIAHELGGLLA